MPENAVEPLPSGTPALFVVTIQGVVASAEVVEGLTGVGEALLRAAWRGSREAVPDDLAALLASLEDPAVWAAHGRGDGRPYWHWWGRLGDGSVAVQRLTATPLGGTADAPEESVASPAPGVAAALAECAAELRTLAAGQGRRFRLGPQP